MTWRIPTHTPVRQESCARARATYKVTVYRLDSLGYSVFLCLVSLAVKNLTHLPDHLSNNFSFRNLLLVRCSFLQRLCQCFRCELAYSRTNIQRLDTFRPEGLIAKERLYDCRLFRFQQRVTNSKCMTLQFPLGDWRR